MVIKFSKEYFISHSHKDEEAHGLLLKKLRNRGIEPYIYSPNKGSPTNLASKDLIEAILDHLALVHIQNGFPEQSFWVAFERDYALRAHKPVYAFDPVTYKIEKSRIPPLNLPIYPSYYSGDKEKMHNLFTFMRNRHFDLNSFFKIEGSTATSFTESFNTVIRNGGYYAIFLSSKTLKTKNLKEEIGFALKSHPDRILIGLLDQFNLKDIPGNLDRIQCVQLFGDRKRSEIERWDDLIVNLYWLVLKSTHKL